MDRIGNLVVMGDSVWVDQSVRADQLLWEWELGRRAAFALFHLDDVMFGGWL